MQWERTVASALAKELAVFKRGQAVHTNHGLLLYNAALELAEGMNAETWCNHLLELINTSHEKMGLAVSPTELNTWRKIYTDSCILRGISQFTLSRFLEAISTLDYAIIIAGAYGRLDLILDLIRRIQSKVSWDPIPATKVDISLREFAFASEFRKNTIPEMSPPSFLSFQFEFSQRPFILRNFAGTWPALHDRPWRSAAYLRSIAGPGRVIPVEVGNDYRSNNWNQKIMEWDCFLSTLDFQDQPASKSRGDELYLAQYDLTIQFPSLRNDIVVPDYVYASLTSADCPNYRPPRNDDNMLFNTWLGPKGTVSPAHTDPYHNCYVQVVGHKSVWLAPPSASPSMYTISSSSGPGMSLHHGLSNNSQVDVFSEPRNLESFPEFLQNVVPVSMSATLAPGDVLFFPPGWWHAMRSETTSFSFSMWF